MFWKRKEKPKKLKKLTSIAFVMAIPANFLLGSVFLVAILRSLGSNQLRMETFFPFLVVLLGTIVCTRTLAVSRLRVFIHESKHALLVLMTGNVMKGFHVHEQEGNVEFQMYKDRAQYGPFITLAPYCFPLFTIPALVFAIAFDSDPMMATTAAAVLGLAFGLDIETAFHDIHPRQTDFKQIVGGFLASGVYIASVFFFIGAVCFLVAAGGRAGIVEAGRVALEMGLAFSAGLPILLRRLASET